MVWRIALWVLSAVLVVNGLLHAYVLAFMPAPMAEQFGILSPLLRGTLAAIYTVCALAIGGGDIFRRPRLVIGAALGLALTAAIEAAYLGMVDRGMAAVSRGLIVVLLALLALGRARLMRDG